MNDWRLNGQQKYLNHVKLKHIKFSNLQYDKSNHEHCEFCLEKISIFSDCIHEAYCTEDEYHWICDDCYNDFKDIFDWKII